MRKILLPIAAALIFSCSSGENNATEIPSSSSKVQNSSSSSIVPSSSSVTQSSSSVGEQTHILDERDGKLYKIVKIGEQVWMAENLNFDTAGGFCYAEGVIDVSADSIAKNCAKYGRLYDWATAMALPISSPNCNSTLSTDNDNCKINIPYHQGICPTGYHIPTNADWDKLFRYVDGNKDTSSPYGSLTAGKALKATNGWSHDGNGTDKYGFSALPGGSRQASNFYSLIGDYGHWWSASESYYDALGDYHASSADYRYMFNYRDGFYWVHMGKSFWISVRCVED